MIYSRDCSIECMRTTRSRHGNLCNVVQSAALLDAFFLPLFMLIAIIVMPRLLSSNPASFNILKDLSKELHPRPLSLGYHTPARLLELPG
jgi:hypothetical protein